eukprot:gene15485-10377_t
MFPYVTAYDMGGGAGWNNPSCGMCACMEDEASGASVCVTVVDQCGTNRDGRDFHFDIAPDAFNELFGAAGQAAGSGYSVWREGDSSCCLGNLG